MERARQKPTWKLSDDHQYGRSIATVVRRVDKGTVTKKIICKASSRRAVIFHFRIEMTVRSFVRSLYTYTLFSPVLSHALNYPMPEKECIHDVCEQQLTILLPLRRCRRWESSERMRTCQYVHMTFNQFATVIYTRIRKHR